METLEKLLALDSNNSIYHFYSGRVYSYLNDKEKAKQAFMHGLETKHNMTIKDLKHKIKMGISNDIQNIETTYEFVGGKNNLGAFIHKYEEREFFTKVLRKRRDGKNEVYFYKDLRNIFPALKRNTPKYISSFEMDGILYLTIEKLDLIKTETTGEDIRRIIEVSNIITSIKYSEIKKHYKLPKYSFVLENRPVSIMRFFSKIHIEKYNLLLFKSLYKLLQENNYPNEVTNIIKRLENVIIDNRIYMYIDPKLHFSLLHGDYIPSNVQKNNINDEIVAIDWGLYIIGPHFLDIAKYFSAAETPYAKVQDWYLNNGDLSVVEKMMFIYSLILLYITRITQKRIHNKIDSLLFPAITHLEELLIEFQNNHQNESIQTLLNINANYQKQYDQLNKRNNQQRKKIRNLERQIEQLNKRHYNMTNSKSWKLTSPLRKIMGLFQRKK